MNRPLLPSSAEGQRSYAERHRTAMLTAEVSGLFCAAVLAMLLLNFAHDRRADPLDSDELDLLRLVSLHRHVQLSFRVILSHSRWTNSSRSGQGAVSFQESNLMHLVGAVEQKATFREGDLSGVTKQGYAQEVVMIS